VSVIITFDPIALGGKNQENHWWTFAVAFAVLIGSGLEAFGRGAVMLTDWWN